MYYFSYDWLANKFKSIIYFFMLLFSALTMYVGFMQIKTLIGGFTIEDRYLTAHKNALGVMLATSLVLFILVISNTNRKRWWRGVF